MNAITSIAIPDDPGVFDSEAVRRHRQSISIHCPNCNDVEMAARCELAAIRDQASSGQRRAQAAVGMLREVAAMAGDAVFAPLPASRLMRIRAALTLTMMAARDVERAHRDG